MTYAIVLILDGEKYALIKTDNEARASIFVALCERYMKQIFPKAQVQISKNLTLNKQLCIHPEKEWIINRLRELHMAIPTGSSDIIEGEYERAE